jgi:ComF family protein
VKAKFCTLLLDLIFPRRCTGCARRGAYLCDHCRGRLAPAEKPEHKDDFAVFPYHERAVKQAVWRLKYQGGSSLSRELGDLLYEHYLDWLAETEQLFPSTGQILVIPIPLSRARRRERGYNQAELLARQFASHDKNKFLLMTEVLIKIRDTKSQMTIKDRGERSRNLAKSFAVPAGTKIKGRTVIVVDDVLTTGGTIAEARRALQRAGARRVYGLAFAHG